MYYISIDEVLELHRHNIKTSSSSVGLLNRSGLESAVAQPRMTFDGHDLHREEKPKEEK